MADEIYHIYAPQNEEAETEASRAIKDQHGNTIDETYATNEELHADFATKEELPQEIIISIASDTVQGTITQEQYDELMNNSSSTIVLKSPRDATSFYERRYVLMLRSKGDLTYARAFNNNDAIALEKLMILKIPGETTTYQWELTSYESSGVDIIEIDNSSGSSTTGTFTADELEKLNGNNAIIKYYDYYNGNTYFIKAADSDYGTSRNYAYYSAIRSIGSAMNAITFSQIKYHVRSGEWSYGASSMMRNTSFKNVDDQSIIGSGNVDSVKMTSITYTDLKQKRDNGTLIPGMQYRITDYTCTTIQSNTSSAGHQFDIIVIADNESTLNENARACLHEDDTYFVNCDLRAWQLKYRIDNDTRMFAWADETNGKGVIYWMKDEFNNEAPYDFKNILMTITVSGYPNMANRSVSNAYTFGGSSDASLNNIENPLQKRVKRCFNNKIMPYFDPSGYNSSPTNQEINMIVFSGNSYDCTIEYGCHYMVFSHAFCVKIGRECSYCYAGGQLRNVIIGTDCRGLQLGALTNGMGGGLNNSTIGDRNSDIAIEINCQTITIGNDCEHVKIAAYTSVATVESNTRYVTILGGTSSNYLSRINIRAGLYGSYSNPLTIIADTTSSVDKYYYTNEATEIIVSNINSFTWSQIALLAENNQIPESWLGQIKIDTGTDGTSRAFRVVDAQGLYGKHIVFLQEYVEQASYGSTNDYPTSSVRTSYLNSMVSKLSSDLQAVLTATDYKVHSTNSSSVVTCSDKLFLPAEKEIFGSASIGYSDEASLLTQFKFYEILSSNSYKYRIKTYYGDSAGTKWFTRSPSATGTNAVVGYNKSGNAIAPSSSDSIGVCACFAL